MMIATEKPKAIVKIIGIYNLCENKTQAMWMINNACSVVFMYV